ncbi:hypothetical protein LWI29_020315 [Acer saccharum]|uniref:Uncharacterized protein n=1 Tax=Acer saccharum TaxID=4024 RepID=A0AA39T567_ACESA|nr:hypothetical protein LWI29_020315 [Acer saccharum]
MPVNRKLQTFIDSSCFNNLNISLTNQAHTCTKDKNTPVISKCCCCSIGGKDLWLVPRPLYLGLLPSHNLLHPILDLHRLAFQANGFATTERPSLRPRFRLVRDEREAATEDTTLQTKLLRRCRKQLEILKAAPNAVTSVENMLVQSIVCQEIRN